MQERTRARWIEYGAAVLAPVATLLILWPLGAMAGDRVLYNAFIPAILLAAYLGGLGPGLVATALGAVLSTYFLVEPFYSLRVETARDVAALILFVLVGAISSGLGESLHRKRRRIVAHEGRRADLALRESDRRWRSLTEAIPQLVWSATPDGACDYFSTQWTQHTGVPEHELLGWRWLDVLHPDDREPTRQFWMGSVAGRGPYDVEYRVRARDGSYRWFKTRGVPIRDSAGEIVKWFGTCTDITELKRAEEALRESEQRFRMFVDHASDAFFLLDDNDVILDVNRQACRSLGYTREELVGMTPTNFDHDVTPSEMESLKTKLDAGEAVAFESRHCRKDAMVFPVEVRAQAFHEGGRRFKLALARDVSDRKRAEEALRASEERFRGTFENAAVGIAHVDGRHCCIRANEVFCDLVGYSPTEVVGETIESVVYPDDLPANLAQFDQVMRGALASFTMEKRFTRKNGEIVWAVLNVSLQRDVAGQPAYCIVIAQDLSERKRLEDELRQANARLDLAVRGSNIAIWECNMPDGRIENSNPTSTNLWESMGYDAATAPTDFPSEFAILFHPIDQERVMREIQELFDSDRQDYESEFRLRCQDGSTRWHLSRGTVLRDPEGKPIRFIGTSADITDLKQAEQALRESEERFRQLAENVRGVFWLQEGGWERLLYISPLYEEFWGRTCQSLYEQPRSWIESVHPEDRDLVFNHFEQQNRGISTETRFRITRPDGSTRWMCCRAFPLKNQAGEVYRVAGLVEDINERRQFEEELRRAKEAAESANRAKDEFLANVSHEIRTPMNAILGMTELVLDTPLADDQRQCLRTVKSAADNLLGILNDLLDFSKIEAGKLELDPADFGLRAILGDTLRTLAIRAHKNGLELVSHVQPDVPDALIGDASRLRQVLLNLVGNAIKFTAEGEVVLRVELAGETAPEEEALIRFTVSDTGVGIPREKQETIFRAFEQEDSSTTRRYGGTGLGLTIAARLVNLMGGTITVESEPGRGSTFTFTARFGKQPHPPGPVADRPPALLSNLPVLIVDDNATNRQILEEWLRAWQMQPVVRGDGLAALDAIWHSAASGRPFPLVLLDARMPDTDGLTLAATIRERVELAATRIILLSSGDLSADMARFRELRINAHLLKPVQQDELLETIYRVMSRAHLDTNGASRPASAESSASGQAAIANALNVLVAEDNEFNAQLLEELLVRRGHRVKVASNGREALALAEGGVFDLLLLDIHMPELDGLQVVQAIRAGELTSGGHLPVIALTAGSRKEERERCLAAGMDDFLSKPIRAADLWAAIDRVVGPRAPEARKAPELLDPVVLWDVCGGDTGILEKLRQTFTSRLPDYMAAVQEALREGDSVRLRESAHKLSGMLAAFSSVAGGVASTLEDHAARDELEEARHLVSRLESMIEELLRLTNGLSLETLRYQAEAADRTDRQ